MRPPLPAAQAVPAGGDMPPAPADAAGENAVPPLDEWLEPQVQAAPASPSPSPTPAQAPETSGEVLAPIGPDFDTEAFSGTEAADAPPSPPAPSRPEDTPAAERQKAPKTALVESIEPVDAAISTEADYAEAERIANSRRDSEADLDLTAAAAALAGYDPPVSPSELAMEGGLTLDPGDSPAAVDHGGVGGAARRPAGRTRLGGFPFGVIAVVLAGALLVVLFWVRMQKSLRELDPPSEAETISVEAPTPAEDATGTDTSASESSTVGTVTNNDPPTLAEPPDDTPARVTPAGGALDRAGPPETNADSGAAASSTPSRASGPAFRRLTDIGWSVADRNLLVTITTDGDIAANRYSHFRLTGSSPREVIVFRDVAGSFDRSQITVGTNGVRSIRTGFHRKANSNELHVVIDLADAATRVAAIRNLGKRLEIDVVGP